MSANRDVLIPATGGDKRYRIRNIHNATEALAEALCAMWATKTTEEACEQLMKDDILVTNQKDKEGQLRVIERQFKAERLRAMSLAPSPRLNAKSLGAARVALS